MAIYKFKMACLKTLLKVEITNCLEINGDYSTSL